jgi:hypothetical protein
LAIHRKIADFGDSCSMLIWQIIVRYIAVHVGCNCARHA